MGKSSSKMEISEFRMSLHYGVATGPVDEVTGLYLDEKVMWEGSISESTGIKINLPRLFGGKKKEGGPVGTAFVLFGEDDQVLPANLTGKIAPGRTPENTPAYRGLLSVFFTGSESSVSTGTAVSRAIWGAQKVGGGFLWANNNPYLKPTAVRAFRKAPIDFEPGLAVISKVVDGRTIRAINPAHILYDIQVNILGDNPVLMGDSWNTAAQTLYDEEFGLAIRWSRQGPIGDVVGDILDTIKGFIYEDLETGNVELALLRDDYDVETLVEINPDNATITGFERRGLGEVVNELVGSWTNPVNEEPSSITLQDTAAIGSQGYVVSDTRDYHSVRWAELCSTLLARDLAESVAPLASCTAEVDRTLWANVKPGAAVKLTWPVDGINLTLIMRVMRVDLPKKGSPGLKLALLEDIFSLARPDYGTPVTSWVDPSTAPDPVTDYQVFTLPALLAGQMQLLNGSDYPEVGAGLLVAPPTTDTQHVELYSWDTPATGEAGWTDHGWRSLSGRIELSVALDAEAETELAEFPSLSTVLSPQVNGYVFIGAGDDADIEIGLITGRTEDESAWIIRRGVLDTVPQAWPVGTPVWFVSPTARIADDVTVRAAGETVRFKLLDKTSLGTYDLDDADEINFDLTDRPYLPLRPANVQVNGTAFGPLSVAGATNIAITWATRNRLLETTQVLGWTDGPVVPEYKQRTIVTIRNFTDDSVILQWLGLWEENSLTFPKSHLERYSSVWVEVSAERSGFESLQKHAIRLTGLPNNPTGEVPPEVPTAEDPPAPSAAPASDAFTVVGGYASGADGTRTPTIVLTGVADDETATDVVFELKLSGDTLWSRATIAIPEGGAIRSEVGGVAPLTVYTPRVAYITPLGLGAWRTLADVTTGELIAGDTSAVGGVGSGVVLGDIADNTYDVSEAARAAMYDMLGRTEDKIDQVRRDTVGRLPAKHALAFQIGEEAAARAAALLAEADDRTTAIAAEASARAAALLDEAAARGAAISSEATTRQTADESLADDIDTLTASLSSEASTRAAAISAEEAARVSADSAQASSISTLAAQMRGAYTGSDLGSVTTGLLYQERIARADADDALSSAITLLSAGAGEQFDPIKIWYFDSGLESWDGNGTPTATAGWIKPAAHGSDPYVFSPTGIAAAGSTYSQLRARIRKTGTPTWEGYLWWRAAADSTWDAARRVTLDEPTYDSNDIGLITISPEWTGTVDRIRIDLSASSDGSDYFEIDWVAVGRPSPGASTASLLSEQTARASADAALSSSITALDTRLGDAEADIVSEASARSTAIAAEATSRDALATQMRGAYTGTTLGSLSSGLVYEERQARSSADSALSSSISTVQSNVDTVSAAVTAEATTRADADTALSSSITSVTAIANSKAKTFVQTTAPSSGMTTNDTWLDSDDGLKPYYYNGSAWVDATDARVPANAAAILAEQTARATADTALASSVTTVTAIANSKARTFVQTTAPSSGMAANDTWLDSDDGLKPYYYNGSAWVDATDARVTANIAAISAEATTRANADTTEATLRETLATQLRGSYSGSSLGSLSSGLLFDERTARTSADAALTSSISVMQAQVDSNAAAITTEATARSTADSAAATRIDTLFATNGAFSSYSNDPTHQNWPVGQSLPTNVITSGTAPTTTRLTSGQVFGEKALRGAGVSTATTGYQRQAAAMKPASAPASGYVVVEWVVTLVAGDFRRAGFEHRLNYTSGYRRATVHLFDQHASPSIGRTYRGSALVALVDVSPTGTVVDQTDYLWLNNSTLFTTQANSAKTITFDRVSWREATAEEVAAGITLPIVSAAVTTETAARIAADNALSSSITSLTSTVSANTAAITSEATTRAAADTSLSSSITSLTSTVNTKGRVFYQTTAPASGMQTNDQWFDSDDGNKAYRYNGTAWVANDDARIATTAAGLTTEQTTRASADSALTSSVTTLTATVGTKGRNYFQTTAPASGMQANDVWYDTDDGNKVYRFNGSAWVAADDTRLATNAAAISSEATARADADTALTNTVNTLSSTVDGNVAAISSEASTRAAADSALSSSIASLTSVVDSNTAAISSEATTRAAADTAISATVTSLTSTVGTKGRTYYQASAPSSGMQTNDQWFDSDDGNKAYRYNGTAWVANDDSRIATTAAGLTTEETTRASADSALTSSVTSLTATVNTKGRNYFQTTAPASGMQTNDVWYDTDDGNKAYRYSGSAWVAADDTRLATNAAAITSEATARANADTAISATVTSLTSTVNTKGRVFYQASAPSSGMQTNDQWFDSDDGNKAYRYSGSAWVPNDDTRIASTAAGLTTEQTTRASADTALTSSVTSLTATVNTKGRNYFQASTPTTGMQTNDVWYDTDDGNKVYRYNGSAWVVADDTRLAGNAAAITSEATARADADTALTNTVNTLSSTVGTKTRTFYQTTAPSSGMQTHDIWYDSDDGNKAYRYNGSAWVANDDARLAANAAAITSEASTRATADTAITASVTSLTSTVNTKGRNYFQTTAPASGMQADDLWFDTDDGNKIYRYTGSAWSVADDSRIATNAAAITSEASTRATADASISATVSSLTSTVGGHTSSISTNASAVADINGRLSASWGVTLDVNNRVSGIKLFTSGGGSTAISYFDVVADKFRVFNGTSNVPAFEVSGGDVYVGGDLVRTKSLLDGAVTSVISAESSSIQLLTMSAAEYMTLRWTPPAAYFAGETGKIRIRVDWGVVVKGGTNQTNVTQVYAEAIGPLLPPEGHIMAGPWLGTSAVQIVQPSNLKSTSVAWTNVGDVWNIGAMIQYLDIKIYGSFGGASGAPSLVGGFIVVTELLK